MRWEEKPNVDALAIHRAGISLNKQGYIPVNALFQSVVPHIYAAGDVIGGPALASTSMEQGRLAVRHAFEMKTHHFPTFLPDRNLYDSRNFFMRL